MANGVYARIAILTGLMEEKVNDINID
jgi:aspartate carbamoyltransferase catalytic subunit